MNIERALTEEAVRLLDVPDTPDLYHRIRRWITVYLRHGAVAPVDMMNWPKGCLMCGLMHQSWKLRESDNASDRAVSVYGMSAVQSHIDRWIKAGMPLFYLDDCLSAQVLFDLARVYADEDLTLHDRFLGAADRVMEFLYAHQTDAEGSLPYRPAHGNGRIFADGIGMAVPFSIRYGLMRQDDDAIDLGLRQITNVMKHLIDEETGLPCHVYSVNDEGELTERIGASDWGRASGWIMYGLKASLDAYEGHTQLSTLAVSVRNRIREYLGSLSEAVIKFRREDGLWGSRITDPSSHIDTSASAMILYALGTSDGLEPLKPHITGSGKVTDAQGECMDIGVYSDSYASYPWSVGMTMMLT